jgi:hypothetical protein
VFQRTDVDRDRAASGVAKFGVLVGLSAIFLDATIAHGLWWENDPYWTYWVTKTFLIMTVFTAGTALIGRGIVPGLALTLVHTLILEVYYQWLSPIGLPQEPQWLAFQDLWLHGFLVHYLVILAGYLLALWIWRRGALRADGPDNAPAVAVTALVAAVLAVVVDGVITEALLVRVFPGLTFFVQHLLLAFVFLYVWLTYVGADRRAVAVGALVLGLIWTGYSMYLGPIGSPWAPPTYLGYEDLWLRSLPGSVVSAFVALLAATTVLRAFVDRVTARVAVVEP